MLLIAGRLYLLLSAVIQGTTLSLHETHFLFPFISCHLVDATLVCMFQVTYQTQILPLRIPRSRSTTPHLYTTTY